jgi:hypothetical protein
LAGFIDLHSSFYKKNCFMNGNYFSKKDFNFYKIRFLPYLLSESSEFFKYNVFFFIYIYIFFFSLINIYIYFKSCKFEMKNKERKNAKSYFHK